MRNYESYADVFINEDQTRKRSKPLFNARTLARADLLTAAYSSDGKIFVKDLEDHRHMIKSDSDVRKIGDVEEAKKKIERKRLAKLSS